MSKSINFLIKLVYNNYSGKICEDDGSSIIVIKKFISISFYKDDIRLLFGTCAFRKITWMS